MGPKALHILYEDNHLLAINKPAGLPTMGVDAGQASAAVLAKQYIRRRYSKPGNVYLGIVSRLDTDTSGVLLMARTSKAAARLSEQFCARSVGKTYWAVVGGQVVPPTGELEDWLLKDDTAQRMTVVTSETPGAKRALLRYRVVGKAAGGTLLEIELLNGRKHQIRLQLAARGWPVCGERKYAVGPPFPDGLGLHARRLTFEHPVRRQPVELLAAPPACWPRWPERA